MLGNEGSHLREVIRQSTVNKGMVVMQIYIQTYFIDKLFVLIFIYLTVPGVSCVMWDLVP